MGKDKKRGDIEFSLISIRYKNEINYQNLVRLVSVLMGVFLIGFGAYNTSDIALVLGVFLVAFLVINSSKPAIVSKPKLIHHKKINMPLFFTSLFSAGVIIFSLGIMFKETYTFLTGIGALVMSILFLKLEQYKQVEQGVQRTILVFVLLVIGMIMLYFGIVLNSILLMGLGVGISGYDIGHLMRFRDGN